MVSHIVGKRGVERDSKQSQDVYIQYKHIVHDSKGMGGWLLGRKQSETSTCDSLIFKHWSVNHLCRIEGGK